MHIHHLIIIDNQLAVLIFAIMSASARTERFHTVVIRGDLPKIKKQYRADQPADLPPESFWTDQVVEDVVGNRWEARQQANRFKLQHMISNGPCE